MTTIDIDAIRNDLDEVRANVGHAEAQYNPHALTALAVGDALLAKIAELERYETAVLHMLALAPDEYRQCIVAARASGSTEDYAKNNARAEMIRIFATGLAERAGLPVADWEQIKQSVPADGVYRAEKPEVGA
ncbi:hypothetical protein ABZY58_12065 [Micromonospora tulbaghiae]|uniref:hypothetical protein n=1 Tax=Micromonospora tulbaghiae TaxID=479978 RepID=UPI0033B50273